MIIAMVIAACMLTSLGVIRVMRQHEVLKLGYRLDRQADQVRQLKETRRRLATTLGMTTVAPDRIRILEVPMHKQVAAQ
jgi:hypothetical protein